MSRSCSKTEVMASGMDLGLCVMNMSVGLCALCHDLKWGMMLTDVGRYC